MKRAWSNERRHRSFSLVYVSPKWNFYKLKSFSQNSLYFTSFVRSGHITGPVSIFIMGHFVALCAICAWRTAFLIPGRHGLFITLGYFHLHMLFRFRCGTRQTCLVTIIFCWKFEKCKDIKITFTLEEKLVKLLLFGITCKFSFQNSTNEQYLNYRLLSII